MNKKVLIISAFWPPQIHVASNRAVAFAKYIQKAGFEVVVLTQAEDIESSDRLENRFRVIRLNAKHILNRASFQKKSSFVAHKLKALKNKFLNRFVSDDLPGFYRAFSDQQGELNLSSCDYVLSIYAPLSAHRIALSLKKQNPLIKWIADFRDEMSFLPGLSKSVKNGLRVWEKKILSSCDLVTSVSQPLLDQFKSLYANNQFLEIRNGFDFSLVKEAESRRDIFKVVYAGTFHGAMNPDLFLKAMTVFKIKNPEKKFNIDFYSGAQNFMMPADLVENVNVHKKVNYESVAKILSSASLLLLVQAVTSRRGVFSGKTFDYLAVNRPILALVDSRDVASELIKSSQAGYVYPLEKSGSAEELSQFIEQIYSDWQKGQLPIRNWDLIEQQSRENQISKLILEIKRLDKQP